MLQPVFSRRKKNGDGVAEVIQAIQLYRRRNKHLTKPAAKMKSFRFATQLLIMKHLLAIFFFTAASLLCNAQSKIPPVDKSPMDMSYYPAGYPVLKIQDKATEPLLARVIFSRPQRNGRSIFGDLVEDWEPTKRQK
jgi:hypothetical protein